MGSGPEGTNGNSSRIISSGKLNRIGGDRSGLFVHKLYEWAGSTPNFYMVASPSTWQDDGFSERLTASSGVVRRRSCGIRLIAACNSVQRGIPIELPSLRGLQRIVSWSMITFFPQLW